MSAERSQILVVEDDRAVRLQLGALLEAAGLAAHLASSGETALALLEGFTPDALLVDLALPGMPGLEVLRRVSARLRHVAAIVLTSSREAETAVECMKSGAYDYLVKPIDEPKLLTTVANALRHRRLALAVESLQREARQRGLEARVPAPAAIALFRRVDRAAETDVSVLVRGAPGPEREAVAHGVHRGSSRAAGPLSVFECAGLPPDRRSRHRRASAGHAGPGPARPAAAGQAWRSSARVGTRSHRAGSTPGGGSHRPAARGGGVHSGPGWLAFETGLAASLLTTLARLLPGAPPGNERPVATGAAPGAASDLAAALIAIPHAETARRLAERAASLAAEHDIPSLARWAEELRSRADVLDVGGLRATLEALPSLAARVAGGPQKTTRVAGLACGPSGV